MYRGNLKRVKILTTLVVTVILGLAGPSLAKKGGGGGKPPPNPPPAVPFDPVIVYGDSGSIFATDAEGANQLPVVKRVHRKGKKTGGTSVSSPAWSPDGRHVVFRIGAGLYSIELIRDPDDPDRKWDGATSEPQLIFEGSVSTPAWHPNGQQIAFVSVPAGSAVSDVFLINVDGTGLINLTNTPDLNEYSLTWSPDGDRLASVETFWMEAVFEDVVVYDIGYDVDGEATIDKKTTLTTQEFNTINGIAWSKAAAQPDLIALSASSGGASQIWCIPVDDPAQAQMLTSNEGSTLHPSWSPDDSQLVVAYTGGLKVVDLDYSGNPMGCPTDFSSEQHIMDDGRVPKWRR